MHSSFSAEHCSNMTSTSCYMSLNLSHCDSLTEFCLWNQLCHSAPCYYSVDTNPSATYCKYILEKNHSRCVFDVALVCTATQLKIQLQSVHVKKQP